MAIQIVMRAPTLLVIRLGVGNMIESSPQETFVLEAAPVEAKWQQKETGPRRKSPQSERGFFD
jgi:hypothetical protein